MATGRERRAERLNERLRGAQRANVEDESFSLDIAGLDQPVAPAPASTRRTPNTAAKRRGAGEDAASATSQARGARQPTRSASRNPYDMPESSKESIAQPAVASARRQSTQQKARNTATAARSSVSRRSATAPATDDDDDPDALETLPAPSSARSPARARMPGSMLDEIEESPAAAPGSGRRRSVRPGSAVLSSARLQDMLDPDEDLPASSSPLAQKKRRSIAASVRSARSSRMGAVAETRAEQEDELSPEQSREQVVAEIESPEPEEEEADEEAEEIDVEEAAKALGRKRPRRSQLAKSPELGSGPPDEEEPVPKRRRGHPPKSPAAQKQPAPKKARLQKQPAKPKDKTAPPTRRQSGNADDAPIEVTVQRFVNYQSRGAAADDADDADPLHAELPFAFRNVETAVDVLAQVCEEVVANTLGQLQQRMGEGDAAGKKACRVKMRAIEAYREELSSRFLQHAIHLNHWQSLRKRVRHVQKEKLALRDEILELKAEREQVALRIDAVRIKHEEDTKDARYRLDTSALMHDIDLAVEQGRDAPELSRAALKQAELANLELLVSQISDQASSTSSTGGFLSQVKEFNAFLERAAVALETR